jgi:hypothetical protein
MSPLLTRATVVSFACLGLACEGNVVSGGRAADDAGAGGFGGGSAIGGSAGRGVTCADSADASFAGAPSSVGCYVGTASGWQRVPCNCEFPVANPNPEPVNVRLTLSSTAVDTPPTLVGPIDMEVEFADEDASWYGPWLAQMRRESDFLVVRSGINTVVRLGAVDVTLDPVPLAGCASRDGTAIVGGTYTDSLQMQAVLIDNDGNIVKTVGGACIKPPHL